jgi:hypothetical protein
MKQVEVDDEDVLLLGFGLIIDFRAIYFTD